MSRRKLTIIALIILAIAAALIFLYISRSPSERTDEPARPGLIKVSASFYPLYFFASEIGGGRVEVKNLTPVGVEPHDYEPTATDMAAIADSRLIVLNGGGLEPWADSLQDVINPDWTQIIVVDGLEREDASGVTETDPHAWLSPRLAQQMVDKIADGLANVDPVSENYYRANAMRLKAELDVLDQEYLDALAVCARTEIITSHAAFSYLAEAYDLQQVPIAGLAPEAEPSPREMAAIVDFARAHDVKYIFFESLASPELSEAIAAEIGAQTLVLNPLEGLTAEEIRVGQDYFSVMRRNLLNLQTALGCQK